MFGCLQHICDAVPFFVMHKIRHTISINSKRALLKLQQIHSLTFLTGFRWFLLLLCLLLANEMCWGEWDFSENKLKF